MAITTRPWNTATPIGYYFDSRTQARVDVFLSDPFAVWFAGLVQAVSRLEGGTYRPASDDGTAGGYVPALLDGGG